QKHSPKRINILILVSARVYLPRLPNYETKLMCRTYRFCHLQTEDWLYFLLIGGNEDVNARKWLLERVKVQYGISFPKA
ncbi:hypothetical protein, partial [Flammeovirga aprica]